MTGNTLLDGEVELWRNSQWRVTNMNLEEIHDGETLGPPYWIALEHLGLREKWIEHMAEKNWVDVAAFSEALAWAREYVERETKQARVADNDVSDAF